MVVNAAADCFLQGEDLAACAHDAAQLPTTSTATKGGLCASIKAEVFIYVQLNRDLMALALI